VTIHSTQKVAVFEGLKNKTKQNKTKQTLPVAWWEYE
jgi:hypothetical protein